MNESLSMIESRLAARDATGARLAADALLAKKELPPEDRVAALKLRARAHEDLADFRAAIERAGLQQRVTYLGRGESLPLRAASSVTA